MLKSALRFGFAVTVMVMTTLACEWLPMGFRPAGSVVQDSLVGGAETHTVVVSGTTVLSYSQDTVYAIPGDAISWRHSDPEVGLQVDLTGVPVSSTRLTIPAGSVGGVTVNLTATPGLYAYSVSAITEDGVTVDDPHIDIKPKREN